VVWSEPLPISLQKKVGRKAFDFTKYYYFTKWTHCLVIDAPQISNDQIVTNDIVEIINESEFIFLGRIDTVVNS
jgi:O-succinylbenzoic acid--CoA ligase